MEKRELIDRQPNKCVYATDEAMLRIGEFTGEYAAMCNTMHCFLMKGMTEMEVTCNFVGQVSETEFSFLKVLELPMTLTVVEGGEQPSYAYYLGDVPVTRSALLEGTVIEEALLNMEDTGRYVWDILFDYFARYGIALGQIDLRFGHVAEHFLVMCGDLTPETMHLYDAAAGKRLWSGEPDGYEIILARLSA